MAFLDTAINANELPKDENSGDFAPLPAGWYNCTIQETDIRSTKAGNGQYIWLKLAITGPSHQGRIVFTNLNIVNPNSKAEEIGKQQLGSIMRAIALPSIQDTDQLVGGQMQVKLSVRKSEEYGDSNDCKAYKALEGGAQPMQQSATPMPQAAPIQHAQSLSAPPAPPAAQPQQAAPAPAGAPPWAR